MSDSGGAGSDRHHVVVVGGGVTGLTAAYRLVRSSNGRPIDVSSDGPVSVEGDGARLRRVLANLLVNARVHTPAGTPVSVRIHRDEDTALIEVADRGPGIAAGDAGRVFERFYRGDPSRSRASGGTGLGLSIVAAVVEAHGGRIDVTSTPGKGATFTVSLPLAPAPVPAAPPPPDRYAGSNARGSDSIA